MVRAVSALATFLLAFHPTVVLTQATPPCETHDCTPLPDEMSLLQARVRASQDSQAGILKQLTSDDSFYDAMQKEIAKPPPIGSPLTVGTTDCPCIGVSDITGESLVDLVVHDKNVELSYPAGFGASCEAWDDDVHPDCKGDGEKPSFCFEKWCYIDPCNCLSTETPRTAGYLPDSKFQGNKVYFNYETCNGTDTYTAEYYPDACVNKMSSHDCFSLDKCTWIQVPTGVGVALEGRCVGNELAGATCGPQRTVDEETWGDGECLCVGISNQNGTVDVIINNESGFEYPIVLGSTCAAWDADNHPDCKRARELHSSIPEWCAQTWCYVDPCSCRMSTPPKTMTYVPGAKFQGKPVYYSYATCGNVDVYTATERSKTETEACVNMKTIDDCNAQGERCTWTDPKRYGWAGCIGSELATLCAAPAEDSAGVRIVAMALPIFLFFQSWHL